MTMFNRKVTYETPDGQILECTFSVAHTPAFISGLPENCHEAEEELGDPVYFLNDEEIDRLEIPAELCKVADAMYEDPDDRRFTWKDEEDERD